MQKLLCLIIISLCTMTAIEAQTSEHDSYSESWQSVQRHELKGLTKSALDEVNLIYDQAKSDNNHPQLIKTLIYKSKFAIILEEDAQLKIINDLKKEAEILRAPTRNLIESIIADIYWQHFQNNRYRYYRRTKTEDKVDPSDFRTWDLETIFEETHKYYQSSLDQKVESQKTDISEFDEILHKYDNSRLYQPTLFDFLANRALSFYSTDEPNLHRPSYKFEIIDTTLLSSNEALISSNLDPRDSLSQRLHALYIYRDLTTAHIADGDPTALIALTIRRMDFVRAHAIFENVDDHYLRALQNLKKKYQGHQAMTEIDYKIAAHLHELSEEYVPVEKEEHRWKKKEALKICEDAIDAYPYSAGAIKCRTLKRRILSESIQVTTENMVPIRKASKILVDYKNIDRLYLKALLISHEDRVKLNAIQSENERITFIKKLKSEKNWNVKLRNEKDYQLHRTEVFVPKFSSGHYLIVATTEQELEENGTYGLAYLQVTDLVLITNKFQQKYVYQVVNRNTGKPIKGAVLHISNSDEGRYNNHIDQTLETDWQGKAEFFVNTYHHNVTTTVTTRNDHAVFGSFYLDDGQPNWNDETNRRQVFLFTDRSIYRPGQPVYFKGIAVQMETNQSHIIANQKVDVTLYDVNRQVIKSMDLKTNEYGSFSGEFLLPTGGLTGNFSIQAKLTELSSNQGSGSVSISVEEYKRPKFEVDFEPVTDTYRLNDTITLTGLAKAFAGSNITDAKVVYRVMRKAQYPRWYWHRRPYINSPALEVDHGQTTTDDNGNFKIKFKSIPDPSIDKSALPTFSYKVVADVTDINGETRSAETYVKVGYHSMDVQVSIDQKIDKDQSSNTVDVTTNNLNGQFISTEVQVKIYKLFAPDNVVRERPWPAPDHKAFSKKKFYKLYPHETFNNEDKKENWKKGALVLDKKIVSEENGKVSLPNIRKWISGSYIIVLEGTDQFDQEVKDEYRFEVYSSQDKKVADNQLFFIKTNKAHYEPGEEVKLLLGSASDDLSVTVTIEKDHRVFATRVVHLKNRIKTITIPVKGDDLGGFAVHYQLVNHNSFLNGSLRINVPYPKHDLEIETSTFRDKLRPAQDEVWSFTLKGPQSEPMVSEILASMYDASLDQFKSHEWRISPIDYYYYPNYSNSGARHSFGISQFRFYNQKYTGTGVGLQRLDQLNWFGFSLQGNYLNRQYLRNIRIAYRDDNQEIGTVIGTVTDQMGEALIGANILIKGTDIGTISDMDGSFSIKAKPGDILVVNYVGFINQEVTVSNDNVYDFVLYGGESLDEVVVAGSRQKTAPMAEVAQADVMLRGRTTGVAAAAMEVAEEEIQDDASPQKESVEGIVPRRNLQETAFFFPHLMTDKEGHVSFNFTAPESLTKWKLQLLAHTKDLATATHQLTAVTQKELMVLPNPPRFLRESDQITLQTKIANLTDQSLQGITELQLYNALNNKRIDTLLDNLNVRQSFTLGAKGNTQVSWTLSIPEGVQAVKYKILAKTDDFSDGEENALPVLTNRMLVTETMPMWLRSNQTKQFTLEKLKNNTSTTLSHHQLTLEITSNPAWYAVQALPYVMEYPYECAEQIFARYYANALGNHIATANPRIKEVFDQWASSDQLISNLEKNQELKSLIIQETPWLRDAQSETEQKKRIALLFDLNKMSNELSSAARKLAQLQLGDGGITWFKGGRYPSRYITQHIATGFGHLDKLGVKRPNAPVDRVVNKAVKYLDNETLSDYQQLLQRASVIRSEAATDSIGIIKEQEYLENYRPHRILIQYLYMRSFYKNQVNKQTQDAIDYYTKQVYKYWLDYNLYSKGMIALIANRNDHPIAKEVLAMLRENAIYNEELGMYWKANRGGWYWYQAPIETHALLIEAFSEIEGDTKTIDELKVWLLKNKQTNRWPTTKSTTDAVYALLLQGTDWLEVTDFVDIEIGGEQIEPLQLENVEVEVGTGYFKTSWSGEEISPSMATVTLGKQSEGVAWGGLYWQYFEDLDKITSAETPLQLSKKLFLKKNTDKGEVLTEIKSDTEVQVGDLVRVRIELKVDRRMEFVHMKDMRAAGFEPVNVLSRYKYQDGLGYYESTRDAATNFFFDRLPIGVYVFEYDVRANNSGDFSNGISTIQCMYAPEFSSHSEGVRVAIGK